MTDKPKPGLVIITPAHEFRSFRADETPEEFIEALVKELDKPWPGAWPEMPSFDEL